MFAFSLSLIGNENKELFNKDDIETYKKQASQLLNFLEYTLNTLGSAKSTQKEKEIIINESFLKIFVDEKVQVEDDLDENRTVPTNKDIQAYLQDIDFFFKKAQFKFTIEKVSHQISEKNSLFFKFQLNRNLKAELINGDTIDTNQIRFVEINFDDNKQDLKIASIYTTKLNEKEELQHWWNTTSKEWKKVLGNNRMLNDSVKLSDVFSYTDSLFVKAFDTTLIVEIDTFLAFDKDTIFINEYDTVSTTLYDTTYFTSESIYNHLKEIIEIQSLEVPDSLNIFNLDPISKLSQLRSLRIANLPIKSLMPLRNLTTLENLECQFTLISSLEPLKYTTNLKSLNIDGNTIYDITPLSRFLMLERLYFSNTLVENIQVLSSLENLQDLRFINTDVNNIDPLKNLLNLIILNFSSTKIKSVDALSGLEKLKILVADDTHIHNLSPLENNKNLIKIYCDHTNIMAEEANRYMRINPNCLVIYDTDQLLNWWAQLSNVWKNTFKKYRKLDATPSKEQLHDLVKLKTIDISNQPSINSLEPLRKFIYLEQLKCNKTRIKSLEPLCYLIALNYLDCSNTEVEKLEFIQNLTNLEYLYLSKSRINSIHYLQKHKYLKELKIENTQVTSLKALSKLTMLQKIYADNTRVSLKEVLKFKEKNNQCLVLFRSSELNHWWKDLNESWRKVFRQSIQVNKSSLSNEELHKISYLSKINLNNQTQLRNLSPLTVLGNLKELRFTGTQISQLIPLRKIQSLELIECGNNPINDLIAIINLPNLKYLDISNIPVKNFKQIRNIKKLETLICPGTKIRNLKYIENLTNLKHLEIYNTKVRNLTPIENLKLKHLKCYNTKINTKKVNKFKVSHIDCEVIFY
jgi:Leucine-rich repeat (LRR) protein